MGVPKFFRWISERYPAISLLITENRIPEFDCLYLDMNGIIHNCTHKDGEDTTFRLSEEEMFIRIFNYIEHLFGKIKPKKLFYMAIDGVAPRAKMNQQRARRFRTALDAERSREKAVKEGIKLPINPPFDSNCITPGTEFMQKLSQQLKYFINKKVTEDSDWQGCEVVLSGHEVPGEGEHKIMEYIRNAKAQPGYDANVRHCLYGLDADLIMLGLLSHDPHFCLLREEVTFGRASRVRSEELEHQNFYLLHLCIVREYLELEFHELKVPGVLKFGFDLESVIDDFILMAFFVGNDFLPNLPRLHINEGALAAMFRLYKLVLPTCDGYINENGVINLPRLVKLIEELAKDERSHFEDDVQDEAWFLSETVQNQMKALPTVHRTGGGKGGKGGKKTKLTITTVQKDLWKNKIKPYLQKRTNTPLNFGADLSAEDRQFVQDLADKLHMPWATKENGKEGRDLIIEFPHRPEGQEQSDEEEEEGSVALFRVIKQYDTANVTEPEKVNSKAISFEDLYQQKFQGWKTKYYLQKFPEWKPEHYQEELTKLCENYVQGLQWVLFYYYRGIASWPWFYRYHYSPLSSDIVLGINADLNFQKGEPFRPFEQLMGVLPDRSKSIVPEAYWPLMTDPKSPIIDFYPHDFLLDMNGKKMEWEAVVKIPFIDEERLLNAMAPINQTLPKEQADRNTFGVSLKFSYSPDVNFLYPSSMPGVFPDISGCRCIENIFELPNVEGLEFRAGLMPGAKVKAGALAGFPSLQNLRCSGVLVERYGVCVFQSDSRNPSMVITLLDAETSGKVEVNKAKLGKRCFVGYPFLQEAKIIKVSDELFDYELDEKGQVRQHHHNDRQISDWLREAAYIENWNAKRMGFEIGTVETLVTVDMLKGLLKTDDGATIKEYAPNTSVRLVYPAQTIVDTVQEEDQRFIEKPALPIEEEYPAGSKAFFLGEFNYGQPLVVHSHNNGKANITLRVPTHKEPEFGRQMINEYQSHNRYTPAYAVARNLGLDPLVLSKLTSSYQIEAIGGLRVNLGLNLKFEGRRQKVLGYSQKSGTGWEFSNLALDLIAKYMVAFPDFFAMAASFANRSDLLASMFWPDPEIATKRVKEIGAWLKNEGINKLDRVPLDAEQLDSRIVHSLTMAGINCAKASAACSSRILQNVPRTALLKPVDAEHVLASQTFSLGDRVTFVSSSGKVPLSSRGTVVGISRTATATLLDIVWDQPFMSGSTLNDRCPPFHGMTVASWSVLNTTNKQAISGSRAGRNINVAPSTSSTDTSAAVRLRDAPAPPPLQGGWKNAAIGNGHGHGGNRGGASHGGYQGPHLQHSSFVYRPHPNAQQQQQQQQHQQQQIQMQQQLQQHQLQIQQQLQLQQNGRGRGHGVSRGGARGGGAVNVSQNNSSPAAYNAVPPPASLNAPTDQRGGYKAGRGRGSQRGWSGPNSHRGGRGGHGFGSAPSAA